MQTEKEYEARKPVFKKGDKVRVISRLKNYLDSTEELCSFIKKQRGAILTIKEVFYSPTGWRMTSYSVEENGCSYDQRWLRLVKAAPPLPKFHPGDKVLVHDDISSLVQKRELESILYFFYREFQGKQRSIKGAILDKEGNFTGCYELEGAPGRNFRESWLKLIQKASQRDTAQTQRDTTQTRT